MSASVSLTFPDGSIRDYAAGTTGAEVAESISKSLAKKAVAIALDGTLRDLSDPVVEGKIEIVTAPIRVRWNSFATMPPTSWPRPCRNCGPAPRSPSVR